MPAKSKSQQRLMGMVHAYKQGKLSKAPATVKKVAASISDTDAEDFATTKHKDIKETMTFKEFLLSEDTGEQ
jgi:hypothetical protein